ncbi:hypothetical protein DKL61_04565 [Gammaproteobacteria bacterium ESL0073]|nr:hypothetical protein DKL61_04565 [Gammaproteobacteria bacterium ESL0073]
MIKATDLIKKDRETIYTVNNDDLYNKYQVITRDYTDLKQACLNKAKWLYSNKLGFLFCSSKMPAVKKLANRLEREFLRTTNKPKFIILYGCTELVNMNIFAWDTGFDTPYYENAVFESKEEARKVAESENLQSFVIVEVSNEN